MSSDRLTMPIGEVMSPAIGAEVPAGPDPVEDIRLILEAAVKAPNAPTARSGASCGQRPRQDPAEFARLYHEAWWAKRRDERG